jgi:cytochrome b
MHDPDVAPSSRPTVLVWDAPVRVFHWLLAGCFAGAYLTSEGESWRLIHVTLGYTMAGLVAFRLIWGVAGTTHARFSSFVRGPSAVLAYLRSMMAGRPEHHTGHNPAGAVAIVALLVLTVVTAAFGWASYNELGGEWVSEVHELAGNLMLIVVGVHLLGVLCGSLMHRENLVRGMITGRKIGAQAHRIASSHWPMAVAILACVCAFWWYQWQAAPSGL